MNNRRGALPCCLDQPMRGLAPIRLSNGNKTLTRMNDDDGRPRRDRPWALIGRKYQLHLRCQDIPPAIILEFPHCAASTNCREFSGDSASSTAESFATVAYLTCRSNRLTL